MPSLRVISHYRNATTTTALMHAGNKRIATRSFCLLHAAGTVTVSRKGIAMTRLVRDRTIVDDAYMLLRDAISFADVPDGVPVIVPLALWQKRRAALIARGETGVWLAPADHPGAIADDVRRLPLIAIDFSQAADGRGYLQARLLRERYRYAGELRAIGDIAWNDLGKLEQSGFDTMAMSDSRDAGAALRGSTDSGAGRTAIACVPCSERHHAIASPGDVWFPCG